MDKALALALPIDSLYMEEVHAEGPASEVGDPFGRDGVVPPSPFSLIDPRSQ